MGIEASTVIGGRSEKWDRNDADFYPTPASVTKALFRDFPQLAHGLVWEPACGDGAISRVIYDVNPSVAVISTDLHHRGYGTGGIDFLKSANVFGATSLVTNPPFFAAEAFIRHASKMGIPFAMLLKGTYWNAAARFDLFKTTGPAVVAPLLWRPNFAPNRGKSPTMEFCWTVWDARPSEHCRFEPMVRP